MSEPHEPWRYKSRTNGPVWTGTLTDADLRDIQDTISDGSRYHGEVVCAAQDLLMEVQRLREENAALKKLAEQRVVQDATQHENCFLCNPHGGVRVGQPRDDGTYEALITVHPSHIQHGDFYSVIGS